MADNNFITKAEIYKLCIQNNKYAIVQQLNINQGTMAFLKNK